MLKSKPPPFILHDTMLTLSVHIYMRIFKLYLYFIQILHSVCRIADVLLNLQQVGNVKYTGWLLQIPCSPKEELITTLQGQAKTMEDELYEWKGLVRAKRNEFYELNYFNTMQLLSLRRELGRLKESERTANVSPEILSLLQCISTKITPTVVSSVVCRVVEESLPEPQRAVSEHPCDVEDEGGAKTPDVTLFSEEAPKVINKNVPKLTEDDLHEQQKEIFANVYCRINCSKQLILMAFEELSNKEKELDRFDIERWCAEKLEEDDFVDFGDDSSDLSDSDGDDASSESSDDSIEEDLKFEYSSSEKVFCLAMHNRVSYRIFTGGGWYIYMSMKCGDCPTQCQKKLSSLRNFLGGGGGGGGESQFHTHV